MSNSAESSNQEIAIARVYAQALLALAESQGQGDAVLEELASMAVELDSDPAFANFLSSPLVDTQERRQSLDRMFKGRMNETLLDTLQVMNSKGRSGLARALVEAYSREYEELRGQVSVAVQSAVPLTDSLRQELRQVVSSLTGKTPQLKESVDPELLGGLVLQVADSRFDTSVFKEIKGLRQQLLDRASQEIQSGKTYFEEAS